MKSQGKTPSDHKKVFVGMSGGVDSSVSAALLKQTGYNVTGIFIKVWQPDWIECNWKEERIEAMRAAAHLGIPFVTLDLESEYKKEVIDYMIEEYRRGRTPNPDVMCNRHVKFGAFWQWAKACGADFIATGHYARNIDGQLLAGVDTNKDQSYFLWTLNQNDLPHIMFPVGGMTKPEVRKLAKKFKLPNADKKDSQGLCFIGKIDVKEFLRHYIKTEKGNVLNEKGEIIGSHSGALLLTIGERHGFTIDAAHKSSDDAPYYVAAKNVAENTITVRHLDTRLQPAGQVSGFATLPKVAEIPPLLMGSVNWVSGVAPTIGMKLQARSRYRQPLQEIKVISASHAVTTLQFKRPQEGVTPGQSLVIYDGDICLGGGIIE